MNRYIIHIAYLCLTLFLLASCNKQEDAMPQDEGMVTLSISAAMASRATNTGDESRTYAELMHTLRIIIFDKDGNVEHNRLYTFDKGLFETENHNFIVKSKENKTIYLLANCEEFAVKKEDNPTIASLDALELKGRDGILQNQDTKPDEGEGTINVLPATAKYSIQVGEKSQTETLYVVHAANKISFEFTNESGQEITISEWRLTPIAQNSYLIPHITGEDENTPEAERWYSKVWAQYNDNELTVEDAGVTNYDVPSDANQEEFEQTCEVKIAADVSEHVTLYSTAEPFYLHESKAKFDPTTGQQQYTVSCVINDRVYSAVLPNLPSLFRGTYIKIKATIKSLDEGEEDHDPFGIIINWQPGDEVEGVLEPAEED